ncbi:MAG: hypothetical protein M5R36_02480 [Deltaproteobacteria bacterium]|nr:hypothetical protein [Deltaproteobacteria bacterium]
MEKAHKIVAIEAEIGWSDVGSYLSLPEVHPPDEHGNAASGDARAIDSTGNILAARQGKIVTLGVSDLIVVHTPDVTFVCPKERAQEIRDVVHALEKDEADNST